MTEYFPIECILLVSESNFQAFQYDLPYESHSQQTDLGLSPPLFNYT